MGGHQKSCVLTMTERRENPMASFRRFGFAMGLSLVLGISGCGGKSAQPSAQGNDDHGHSHGADGGHDHGGHGDTPLPMDIELSEQARLNLGLKTAKVELQDYWKSLVVPGQVVNLPGQSERRINSTVQGTIAKVHVLPGQTVRPGDPLMELAVTSELLASSQANLLRLLQDIELNDAELKRLAPVSEVGAVSQKLILEKQYEKRRLESSKQVALQELMVRGLSPAQVKEIIETKTLVRSFTIAVPHVPDEKVEPVSTSASPEKKPDDAVSYVVEKLDVFPGKLVNPGDELCDLAQHAMLQIRGDAFETESKQLYEAISHQWPVTAAFELGDKEPLERTDLKVLYASGVIDPTSRSFEFFLPLANEVIQDQLGPDGRSFRSWRFKPGQKVTLRVPVEKLTELFVIPADAVATEGAESFLFKVNGKMLVRQSIAVVYRDRQKVVVANDGSIFPDDEIAINQAYAIQLAIKKAQGSGVDMHAGHNH